MLTIYVTAFILIMASMCLALGVRYNRRLLSSCLSVYVEEGRVRMAIDFLVRLLCEVRRD